MILDALDQLSNAQAITADAVSTNTKDFGNVTPKNDPFSGEPLAIVFTVDVAADFTTGDETYAFEAIVSASANLGTPTVLARRVIAASLLTAGSVHVLTVPPVEATAMLRYFGANYDVGGTTPTITVTAHLVPLKNIDQFKAYAKAYTIS